MQTVQVLDIPLYALNIPSAIHDVIDICSNHPKKNRCISATGAHGMIIAKKEKAFSNLLQSFYMNLPDGMPGVWIGKLKGAKEMDRCYGPDFFAALMEASAGNSINHFFCGGKEGVADQLKTVCKQKFGNHHVVGTFCPPFIPIKDIDFQAIATAINACNTDIVWIGISTPRQEQFAKALSEYTNVHFIITVGAAFDFHIGSVRQAPRLVQRAGMEWFYRLLMEPKRLCKRYLEIVPLFIIYNIIDFTKKLQLLKQKRT